MQMQSLAGLTGPGLALLVSIWTMAAVPFASGSTDGRQLPAYFCNLARLPENPTTLGGYLATFKLETNPGPNSQVENGVTKVRGRPLAAPQGTVFET